MAQTKTKKKTPQAAGLEIIKPRKQRGSSDEALIVSRICFVLWQAKDGVTLADMSRTTGFEAESLKTFATEKDGLWYMDMPFVGYDREKNQFFRKEGWRWFTATVSNVSDHVLIENDRGERVDCETLLDVCENMLPGDRVLACEADGRTDTVWIAALLEQPARRYICPLDYLDLRKKALKSLRPVSRFFTMASIDLDKPWQVPGGRDVKIQVETDPRPLGFTGTPTGHVVKVIEDADTSSGELEVALAKYDLPHIFSEAVVKEAEALPSDPGAEEADERIDLRDIGFMTIDGEDSRDFDDAVWCTPVKSGWRLLVAIADVSHYVTEGSALNKEALNRATSVYFPSCVIPMLPEKLSNGLCSLNPGVDRAVLVCDMMVGTDGLVSAYQFYPALIHSHARLTYTAVWAALQGKSDDLIGRGGSLDDIKVLYDLYKAFRAARVRRGAIDFETTETQFELDEKGLIKAIHRRDHNDAHRLIEECMLAANVCAADFIGRKKAMSLFRIHEPPAADKLAALRATLSSMHLRLGGGDKPGAADFEKVLACLKESPVSDVVQAAMLRSMQRAVYSPDNCGHYGLNYPAYTHFTSPIRRYPDLLVHRTIRALLSRRKYSPVFEGDFTRLMDGFNGRKLTRENAERAQNRETPVAARQVKQLEVWRELGLICSAAERRADDASREVVSWLKCRYISQFCGKSFEGTVTGVIAAGLYVTLDDPYVEGFVHVSKIGPDYYEFDASENTMTGRSGREKFYIGKRVKATVESADTETLRVDFTIYTGEREGFGSRGFGRRRFDDWDFDDDDDDGDDWSSFREDFDFDEDFPKPRKKRKKKNKNKNKTVAK